MKRIERHRAWVRVGAVRREAVLALVILGAFVVGFGVTLLLLPEAQTVRVAASGEESAAVEATTPDVAAVPGAEVAQSKEALKKGQEGRVPAKDSWLVEEQVDYFKLLKDDDMKYRGYPRFKAAPQIVPRIQVTRLTGVAPAVFHFSISDTTMPGALLEHDEAVDPWRDLHVEWDFGDSGCTDRIRDARYGVDRNPNTDQQGPEAIHAYRTPGTYTVTCTVKARTGPDQYTVATTTTVRQNQYQTLFFPQGSSGSFRLEFPAGSGNWTEVIPLQYGSVFTSGPLGSPTGFSLVSALEALPTIGPGNVRISQNQHTDTTQAMYWIIEFCGALGGQSHALMGIDKTNVDGGDLPTRHTLQGRTASGPLNSGQFRLTYNGNPAGQPSGQTAWINYNATAATVQAAINAAIGANSVVVSGGPIGEPANVPSGQTWLVDYVAPQWRHIFVGRPSVALQNWPPGDFPIYESYTGHPPFSTDTLIWEHLPGGTAAGITVNAGTVVTRYYDPVGGNDANDGTEASPKRTWANLSAWIVGATASEYRRALLKRGTTFSDSITNAFMFQTGLKFARFGAYGTGAKPRLALVPTVSTKPSIFGPTMTMASARGKQTLYEDVVFDSIDIVTPHTFRLESAISGDNFYKYAQRLYFLDCDIREDIAISNQHGNEEIAFINCHIDGTGYRGTPVLYRSHWFCIQGGSIVGASSTVGPGNYQLHHCIYPIAFAHDLMRWIDMRDSICVGLAWRGSVSSYPHLSHFRIVTDCFMRGSSGGVAYGRGHNPQEQREGGIAKHFLLDGCWIQAGSDAGIWIPFEQLTKVPNSDPAIYRYMSSHQIQGGGNNLPFHYAKVGGMFSTGGAHSTTVRNCRTWAKEMPSTPVPVGDPQLPSFVPGTPMMFSCIKVELLETILQIYNNEIDHSGINGMTTHIQKSSGWYIVDNTFRVARRAVSMLDVEAAPDNGVTSPGRRVFDRNFVEIFGEHLRYPSEYAFHFRGKTPPDYTFNEAVAAGLIGPNNVKGTLPWPDVKTGNFRDNHSVDLGGIPVKLKRDRGWAR